MMTHPGGEHLLFWVALGIPSVLLLIGGAVHAVHHARLLEVLRDQEVAPRFIRPLAIGLVAAELGLPLGLFAAIALSDILLVRLIAGACGLLYIGFALYARRLSSMADVPCGCSSSETPANRWVTIRAAVMAVLCLGASGLAVSTLPGLTSLLAATLIVLAIASFAAIAWHAPVVFAGRKGEPAREAMWTS